MKKVRVLATIGAILLIIGLGVQMIQYQEQIDKYKKQVDKCKTEVKDLHERVDQALIKLNKTEAENQYLWDNYYMNASNYEGYEYYE